jgi:hypothetical protein
VQYVLEIGASTKRGAMATLRRAAFVALARGNGTGSRRLLEARVLQRHEGDYLAAPFVSAFQSLQTTARSLLCVDDHASSICTFLQIRKGRHGFVQSVGLADQRIEIEASLTIQIEIHWEISFEIHAAIHRSH